MAVHTTSLINEVLKRYPNENTKVIASDFNITVQAIYRIVARFNVKKSQEYLDNWELSGRGRMIECGKAYRFKKGHVSWNKDKSPKDYMPAESYDKIKPTQFKKGGLPANTKHDGAIVLRHDKSGQSYYYIRIAKAKWALLHAKIYQDAHGPIPKNHIIVFKDRNSLNVTLDNLECITRQENMLRNSFHRLTPEIKQTIKVLTKLKKTIRNGKKQD
jgi:Mor family transcriptional regulator